VHDWQWNFLCNPVEGQGHCYCSLSLSSEFSGGVCPLFGSAPRAKWFRDGVTWHTIMSRPGGLLKCIAAKQMYCVCVCFDSYSLCVMYKRLYVCVWVWECVLRPSYQMHINILPRRHVSAASTWHSVSFIHMKYKLDADFGLFDPPGGQPPVLYCEANA